MIILVALTAPSVLLPDRYLRSWYLALRGNHWVFSGTSGKFVLSTSVPVFSTPNMSDPFVVGLKSRLSTEQMLPWYCAGPCAADSETWNSLAVSQPDDPSIPVDVTPLVAAHFDFQDVSYYSLKAWSQWTEEGQHCSLLFIQHYRLHHADHSSTPHSQWGILKQNRPCAKQLRMTLADGSSVPVYGTTGSYISMRAEPLSMQPTRNMRHVCPITSSSMKKRTSRKSTLPSCWTEGSFSRGRDISGAPCRPNRSGRLSPPLRPQDHQDYKSFATTIGMIRRVCKCSCTLSERSACTYNWNKRCTHLRGMVDSVILAHQSFSSPVGEDLGRLQLTWCVRELLAGQQVKTNHGAN